MGHKTIDCRKPKYDNDRINSRMSRNTNPVDRRRYNERTSSEGRPYAKRRQIVCYKCNNFGHIAQNYHASMINRILEAKLQYVSYATTSDIQQSIAEWTETSKIEGTKEETLEIEEMMEGMSEMIKRTMRGTWN